MTALRVAYLLGTAGGAWGGLERHTFDVAAEMARRGHAVTVLAAPEYRDRCPPGVGFAPVAWRRARWNPLLWLDVRRGLAAARAQVVHAQGSKAAAVLSLAGAPSGALTLGTVHGTKSGHVAYARLDRVIAVSRRIAGQIAHPHVEVVNNGIAPVRATVAQQASVAAWRAGHPGDVVVAVGRLAHVKGFDLLLQAWPADAGANLVIVGDGPERAGLEAIIARRGLRNAFLAGHRTDVPAWLEVARFMVMSSRREGFPYVLVEALHAGCPAVSTRVSGVEEILPAAWQVEPGDVDALRGLVGRALDGRDALAADQAPVIAGARANLTLESMVTRLESIYLEGLGAGGAGR